MRKLTIACMVIALAVMGCPRQKVIRELGDPIADVGDLCGRYAGFPEQGQIFDGANDQIHQIAPAQYSMTIELWGPNEFDGDGWIVIHDFNQCVGPIRLTWEQEGNMLFVNGDGPGSEHWSGNGVYVDCNDTSILYCSNNFESDMVLEMTIFRDAQVRECPTEMHLLVRRVGDGDSCP